MSLHFFILNHYLLFDQFSRTKGKRLQLVVKRSISPLEDRNMDYDAQTPEELDSEQSSDDEVSLHCTGSTRLIL